MVASQQMSSWQAVPMLVGGETPPPAANRFLIFGENAVHSAEQFRERLPLEIDSASTYRDALAALKSRSYAALFAASPMTEPGSAACLIREFRRLNPEGATIYHGWDYRIEISGPKAVACGADFLIVGATLKHELMIFLEVALRAKQERLVPDPPSVSWYEGVLKDCFPSSPFWQIAESFRTQELPPSHYE